MPKFMNNGSTDEQEKENRHLKMCEKMGCIGCLDAVGVSL